MAESESGADKSEEPTEKRLRESREKGQIARSKELNTLAVTLGGFGGMLAFGGSMGSAMLDIMRGNFSLPRDVIMDERSMGLWFAASGQIAIDALFSPVRNVGYRVENTRVGEITNYDKLIMNIETDGTINPEEAVTLSAQLLIDHVSLLLNKPSNE